MQYVSASPLTSRKLMPSDHVPQQLLPLALELLTGAEMEGRGRGGAWRCVKNCTD
eukprot:COSAG02_NODE_27118_length_616_cov_1.584139_1_plen_54_part_10